MSPLVVPAAGFVGARDSHAAIVHVIGFIGTFLVLGAYFLLSTGRIKAASLPYQGLNLIGAGLLTFYGVLLAAWASIALNAVWGLIAVLALVRVTRAVRERSGDGAD